MSLIIYCFQRAIWNMDNTLVNFRQLINLHHIPGLKNLALNLVLLHLESWFFILTDYLRLFKIGSRLLLDIYEIAILN